MFVPVPVAGADAVLRPNEVCPILEAPGSHDTERLWQHRYRRPQEEHAVIRGNARDRTASDDLGGAGWIVVVGRAIHASLLRPRLKAPRGIGDDHSIAFLRKCGLLETKVDFLRALNLLQGRFGRD